MNITCDENHIYRVDGSIYPGVTEILEDAWLIDNRWYTEGGAIRGTYIHRICHYIDEGDLDESTVDEAFKPRVEAYKRFKEDTGFNVSYNEMPVFHPLYKYCGTLDKIGELNGKKILLDIKTGPYQKWVSLQLHAYVEALKFNSAFGTWLTDHQIHVYTLHLKSNGKYDLKKVEINPVEQQAFLSCVRLYHWKRS